MKTIRTSVPPSVTERSFNCPRCGALASQEWYRALAERCQGEDGLPAVITPKIASEFEEMQSFTQDQDAETIQYFNKLALGDTFLSKDTTSGYGKDFANLFASQCFSCSQVSVWIYDRLIHPQTGSAPTPNPDMPDEIRPDYEEASSILDLSPRGAAALLRLALQKLCIKLGGKGKNINDDIAQLVKSGLSPKIQKALDVLRVNGNNAVHPGELDLKDDRANAERLFTLINVIVDAMITQPGQIDTMFDSLPEGAKKAIARRDGPQTP